MSSDEPLLKKARTVKDESKSPNFDTFMNEIELETSQFTSVLRQETPDCLDAEIDEALMKFDEFDDIIIPKEEHQETLGLSSNSSPETSTFDAPRHSASSITSNEDEPKEKLKSSAPPIDITTVSTLKQAMAGTSKLIGTFTTLKTTYLKLCKEFNYLLGKFNDNERIKIELIHENNELKKLLVEVIKEKELDRKQYKADLQALKARC